MHTINQVIQSLDLLKDEIAAINAEAITKDGEMVSWIGCDTPWMADKDNYGKLVTIINMLAKRIPDDKIKDKDVQKAIGAVEEMMGVKLDIERGKA